jgi:Domain of unknown function (DUF4384)
MKVKLFSALLLSLASCTAAQTLTPRQLFYQDDAEVKPAPKPGAAPKPAPKAPPKAAPQSTAKRPSPPPATSEVATPPHPPAVVTNATYGMEKPLALRYALARVTGGVESEVDPGATFHSGDMVRVKVEGNRDGYLYVIARGSSGNWKPLFPAPDINGGDNHVAGHANYALPSSTQAFTFDEQAGEEKLFIIYSAEPIRDMEGMIPSLAQQPRPDRPAASKGLPMVSASLAPITDNFVSQMRNSYSRDLVVQTVTPKAPDPQAEAASPRSENAVYVVNKSGGRLVADIRLEHK